MSPPAGRSLEILETAIYARDLDATQEFYGELLGLEIITRHPQRHVFFRCGRSVLLIFHPDQSRRVDQSPEFIHGTDGSGHVCFAATAEELDGWKQLFESTQVPLEAELEWPGGGRSIYLRDPVGNSVEFAERKLWFDEFDRP